MTKFLWDIKVSHLHIMLDLLILKNKYLEERKED